MAKITMDDIRADYGLFFLAMNPTYTYEVFQQEKVIPVLQRAVEDTPGYERIMNIEPFGHSKSDLGTWNFIPYYMGRHPERNVLLLCYGHKLARRFGRIIRNKMKSELYKELFPASEITKFSHAADEFEVVGGGHFWACGFDGQINGLRIHLLDIDDPHKNMQTATSETIMETIRSTYTSVVNSRLEPGAVIIANTTRWAPTDWAGWRMQEDGAVDHFTGEKYDDLKGVKNAQTQQAGSNSAVAPH